MAVKLLVAGESNSGKTTLTKGLEESLVISHDGKRYPYKNPHASISSFDSTDELIAFVNTKIEAYNAKFNTYPRTVVFDSVSRIFDTLYDACNRKYTGFSIFQNLDKEIKAFTNYIEDVLIASNINVVILSHAIYDSDTSKYNLVGKGSFAKVGSFLSVVDESIFVEAKSSKRVLHFRSTKFPARTLQDDNPDSVSAEDFNLSVYVNHLEEVNSAVNEFGL